MDPLVWLEEMKKKKAAETPSRGPVGTFFSGLARGALVRFPEFVGYGIENIAPDFGSTLRAGAKTLEEEHDFLKPSKEEKESLLYRGISGTGENALTSMGLPALGALVGSVVPVVGTAVGAAAGAAANLAMFYTSTYNQFMDEAERSGIDAEKAKPYANFSAMVETGGELLSDLVGAFSFGLGKVISKGATTATLREVLRTPAKELAFAAGKTLATEVGTEMGQEASQAWAAGRVGMEGPSPGEAAVEAILPAAGMAIMFGGGAHGINFLNRRNMERVLQNPIPEDAAHEPLASGVEARLKAVEIVSNALEEKEETKEFAPLWKQYAVGQILENGPIDLDKPFDTLSFKIGALEDEILKGAKSFTGSDTGKKEEVAEQTKKAEVIDQIAQAETDTINGDANLPDIVAAGPRGFSESMWDSTLKEIDDEVDSITRYVTSIGQSSEARIDTLKEELSRLPKGSKKRKKEIDAEIAIARSNMKAVGTHYDTGWSNTWNFMLKTGAELAKNSGIPEAMMPEVFSAFNEELNTSSPLVREKSYDKTPHLIFEEILEKYKPKAEKAKEEAAKEETKETTVIGGGTNKPKEEVKPPNYYERGPNGELSLYEIDAIMAGIEGREIEPKPEEEEVTQSGQDRQGQEEGQAQGQGQQEDVTESVEQTEQLLSPGEIDSLLKEVNQEEVSDDAVRKQEEAKEPEVAKAEGVSETMPQPPLDEKAQEAATSTQNDLPQPTDEQIKAGNYQKGHITLHGLDISIENPQGSVRKGVDRGGKEWSVEMKDHYGYVKGTKGRDKDHIDTFIGPDQESRSVFVVNQVNPDTGKFDEHKVMLGFNTEEEAREGYLRNYEKGWKGLGSIVAMDMEAFKEWTKTGDTTKEAPAEGPKDIQAETESMSKEEKLGVIDDIFDKKVEQTVNKEAPATKRTPTEKSEPKGEPSKESVAPKSASASDTLNKAASHGYEAVSEAVTGLYELLGGKSLKSFPGGINEETYAKAKPHFEAMWDHAKKAGTSLREFVEQVFDIFGDAIRPYLKRFVLEVTEPKSDQGPKENSGNEEKPTEKITGGPDTEKRKRRTKEEVEQARKEREEKRLLREQERKLKEAAGHKNKFVDIGEVWDPFTIKQRFDKIDNDSPQGIAKQVMASVGRTEVFPINLQEGATPGTKRFLVSVRGAIKPFHDYFASRNVYKSRYSHKSSVDSILEWMNEFDANATINDKLEKIKTAASEYAHTVGLIEDVISTAMSVSQARDALAGLVLNEYGRKVLLDREQSVFMRDTSFSDYGNKLSSYVKNHGIKLLDALRTWGFYANDEGKETPKSATTRIRNQSVVREGLPDRRTGDITSTQEFDAPFGFKGVVYGDWVESKERQRVVNAAFDALHDLAELLGAPTKGIAFGKRLALQFGNLGGFNTKAAGLYFPNQDTINLTKGSGDGALCHEWSHALDDFIGANVTDDIKEALRWKYDFAEGEALARAVLDPERNAAYRHDWEFRGLKGIELAKKVISERWDATVRSKTQYFADCEEAGNSAYQSADEEMFARAFEAYVLDNLSGTNNYLVNETAEDGLISPQAGYTQMIYPAGEERALFNGYMQEFIESIEWDKDGNPSIDPDKRNISQKIAEEAEKQKADLLNRLEEIYNAMFQGEKSEGGLYWYAYKTTSRGMGMQPNGYLALDDSYREEGLEGTGAVGYPEPLPAQWILDHHLKSIVYNKGEGFLLINEEVEGGIKTVGMDGPRILEGDETEDVRSPRKDGDVEKGGPPGAEDGRDGIGTAGPLGGDRGNSTGGRSEEVHTPPGRGVGTDTAGGPDALQSTGNYLIQDPGEIGLRSIDQRFRENVAAIRVLKALEQQRLKPTPEEKSVLVRYSGWGGLGQATSRTPTTAWKQRADLLTSVLDEQELRAARLSSDTAYHTTADTIQGVYRALNHLGFAKGKILEPALGSGNFFGMMTQAMSKESNLYGVEPDKIAYRIASLLYDDAKIQNGLLQDVRLPLNYFDAVVSNVPFSGEIRPADKRHNKHGLTLHNYFFVKALHLVRPGGLVAFVTSRHTMDATEDKARTEIAKLGDFLGAVRLPIGQFNSVSDDVVMDVIFIQRKEHGATRDDVPWINVKDIEGTRINKFGNEVKYSAPVNEYFINHPEMVLGDTIVSQDRYGEDFIKVDGTGRSLKEDFKKAIENLPKDVYKAESIDTALKPEDMVPSPQTVREGAFFVGEDGKLYSSVKGLSKRVPETDGRDKEFGERIRKFIQLISIRRELLRAQLYGLPDKEVKALQYKLGVVYDTFVMKWGPINDEWVADCFVSDPDYPNLMALEHWDPETKTATKADIFTEWVLPKYEIPTQAGSAEDSLSYSLSYKGKIDFAYMQSISGMTREALISDLGGSIYDDPEAGGWVTRDEYLSGDIVHKLTVAKEMAAQDKAYQRNVDALEGVRPKPLSVSQIEVSLGMHWIPTNVIESFVTEKLKLDEGRVQVRVSRNAMHNTWFMAPVKGDNYGATDAESMREWDRARESVFSISQLGTRDVPFPDLVLLALNNKMPKVTRTDWKTRREWVDVQATEAATAKMDELKAKFTEWLWSDHYRAWELLDKYNNELNNLIKRVYNGSHLTFPGKNPNYPVPTKGRPKGLYHTQMNAVWRYISNGNTYLAHDMGTGKSISFALIAMEAKRLGLKKKPIIVTQKSVVRQLANEFINLYPAANVLVCELGNDMVKNRVQLAKIASNNWDAVIMAHSSFERIPLGPDITATLLQEELDEYEIALRDHQASSRGSAAERRVESWFSSRINAMQERIEKELAVNEETRSKHLYWEELGCDLLLVDEAHEYKNVPFTTNLGYVKGVDPDRSDTGMNVYFKTKYMNSTYRHPNGKPNGVVFGSGTPLSNSAAELFNISRYLQPDLMKARGIFSFDAWASMHADIGQMIEPKLTGDGFRFATKIREFVNLPELLGMTSQVIDYVKADDVGLMRPPIAGGAAKNVVIKQNPYVAAYQQIIQQRAIAIMNDPHHSEYGGIPDNVLRLVGDGKKVAIDQRMIAEFSGTPAHEDSKVLKCVENIVRHYEESSKERGVQLVFSDLGVPKGKPFVPLSDAKLDAMSEDERIQYHLEAENAPQTDFNMYDAMKIELVKRGIPEREIAYIHDIDKGAPKQRDARLLALMRKVNNGDIRVLIGTTEKLGTGTNVQRRVTAIHHMDIWWNYASYAQRNARGVRTGNIFPEVHIYNYVVENTIDSFVWDKVAHKGVILNSILSADGSVRKVGDVGEEVITARMAAALASGNPLRVEQATLDREVTSLSLQRSEFINGRRQLEVERGHLKDGIKSSEAAIERYKLDIPELELVDAVKIGDKTYQLDKDGKEIADAIQKIASADLASWENGGIRHVGTLGAAVKTVAPSPILENGVEVGQEETVSYELSPAGWGVSFSRTYGGIDILLTSSRDNWSRAYASVQLDEKGPPIIKSITGNLSRSVTLTLSNLRDLIPARESEISLSEQKIKDIEEEIKKPFGKEDVLREKQARLNEVNKELFTLDSHGDDPRKGIPMANYTPEVVLLDDYGRGWLTYHDGNTMVPEEDKDRVAIRATKEVEAARRGRKHIKFKGGPSYYEPVLSININLVVEDPGKANTLRPVTPIAYWETAGGKDKLIYFSNKMVMDAKEYSLLAGTMGAKSFRESSRRYDRTILAFNEKNEVVGAANAHYPEHYGEQAPNSLEQAANGQSPLFNDAGFFTLPADIVNAIRPLAGKAQEAYPHVVALGKRVMAEGATKLSDFVSRMKTYLGDLYARLKGLVTKAFGEVKRWYKASPLGNERGSISFAPTQKIEGVPIEELSGSPEVAYEKDPSFKGKLTDFFNHFKKPELTQDHPDIGLFEKHYMVPFFKGMKYVPWKQAVDISISRREKRQELNRDYLGRVQEFFNLSGESLARVEKVLIETDATLPYRYQDLMADARAAYAEDDPEGAKKIREKASQIKRLRRFNDDEIEDGIRIAGTGEIVYLTDKEAEVYKQVRKLLDDMHRDWYANQIEVAIKKYQGKPWHDLLRSMMLAEDVDVEKPRKALQRLTYNKYKAKTEEGLKKSQTRDINILARSLKEKSDLNDKKELVAAVKEMLKAYRKHVGSLNAIKKARRRMGMWMGYFPRVRGKGKYFINLYEIEHTTNDQGEDIIKKHLVYNSTLNNEYERQKMVQELKSEYRGTEYEIETGEIKREPEGSYVGVGDVNLQRILDRAISKIKTTEDMDEKSAAALNRSMSEAIANELKARGFSGHNIRRKWKLIKGYQQTGLQTVLRDYITGFTGLSTKQEAAMDFFDLLGSLDRSQTGLFEDISKYARDMLRNQEALDRISGKARSLAFVWYLGAMLRPMLLQLTQNCVTGIPFFAEKMREWGIKGSAEKSYYLAMKDAARSKLNKETGGVSGKNISTVEKKMLREMSAKGIAEDQFVQEITGRLKGRFGKLYDKAVYYMSLPFSGMEIFNRKSAALAMFRLSWKKNSHLKETERYDAAFADARDYVYQTHYLYGKENLPRIASGGDVSSVAARTALTFRSFTHNYILSLLESKDWRTIAHSLAYVAMFGGLAGLPLIKDILELIERLTGWSVTKKVRETLRKFGGRTLETLGMHGLPALAGANISGSMAIGIPLVGETPSDTVFGAMGGLADKVVKSGKALERGDYYRAVENIAPEFLANPMRATRMATTGATTDSGKRIYGADGRPLKLSPYETFLKMAGINPSEYSGHTESHRSAMNVREYFKDWHDEIFESYRVAKLNKDAKGMAKATKEIALYNKAVREKGEGLVGTIKLSQVAQAAKSKPSAQQKREMRYERSYLSVAQ